MISAQLLTVLQMTDSMFPSGAFVHSEGLETYIQQGAISTPEQLQQLIAIRLSDGVGLQDMIAMHSAMSIYHKRDDKTLLFLDQMLSAMKTAKESRDASCRVGKQMLRTVLALNDDEFLSLYQSYIQHQSAAGHAALTFGLVCASLRIEKQIALTAYAYSLVSSQVSAAIKLMRLGQTRAQKIIYGLQPVIDETVSTALTLNINDMQSFTPALDIRTMQHEFLFRRLFNS